jgi:hypothetical protein
LRKSTTLTYEGAVVAITFVLGSGWLRDGSYCSYSFSSKWKSRIIGMYDSSFSEIMAITLRSRDISPLVMEYHVIITLTLEKYFRGRLHTPLQICLNINCGSVTVSLKGGVNLNIIWDLSASTTW